MPFWKKRDLEPEETNLEENISESQDSNEVDKEIPSYLKETESKKPKKGLVAREEDDELTEEAIMEETEQEYAEIDRLKEIEGKVKLILKESIIKDFLDEEKSPHVTDVSFNGTHLYVQDNKKGRQRIIQPEDTPEKYKFNSKNISALLKKVANAKGKNFTEEEAILDTEMDGYRINGVHIKASPYGATMALRISRPRLAITPENSHIVAPKPILDFLSLLMITNENLLISGITGSGKTELQKYLVGFIPDTHYISLMEDTMDSHIKELYPEKNINSWRTLTEKARKNIIGFPTLIKAGLRNNPDRLMISEIRGGEEAYDLLVATLTGHSVLTTLHAKSAMHIPSRLRSMIGQAMSLDPEILGEDIVSHLPYGCHMELVSRNGEYTRRIREVVEYTGYANGKVDCNIIYRVRSKFVKENAKDEGKYIEIVEYNPISEKSIQMIKDAQQYHLLPPELVNPPSSKSNKIKK